MSMNATYFIPCTAAGQQQAKKKVVLIETLNSPLEFVF